ncbi:MAG: AI-2E family transporter [Acidimicrobiales bacterium]
MSEAEQPSYPGPVLRIAASYGWRLLVVGTVGYFAFRLISHLMTLVIPFSVALLVTALLRPVLVFLRRRGVPRVAATLLSVLGALLLIGGVVSLVVVRATDEFPQVGDQINRLVPHLKNWLITGPLHVNSTTVNHLSDTLTHLVQTHSSAIASTAVSTGKTVLDILTELVLAIFIVVFLLYYGEGVWNFLIRGFPSAVRAKVDGAGRAAWNTLSHYVRGTLVVAAFHGTVIAITLAVLGVPLVAPLAVLVSLGSFVPLVGAVVTGLLAVGVAGVTQGFVSALVVVIVLLVDNQVEAHVLQPLVVGRYVKIHPLAVVVSLVVGAIFLNIFGAIIAVPVVACVNSAVRALLASRDLDQPMDPAKTDSDPSEPAASEERALHAGEAPAG